MFSLRSVCLFVCPSDNWKSCEQILTKFLTRDQWVQFWWWQSGDTGVQSLKSAFTGLSRKLPTDFDEILLTAGVWPRDQLITFWWQSASLSGSGSSLRITIQIREELPRCQHTEQMRCKNHSAVLLCWRSAEVSALWVLLVFRLNPLFLIWRFYW